VFDADRPEALVVVSRARRNFRLASGALLLGSAIDTLPPGALVRAIRNRAPAGGADFEIEVAPEARGFRLLPEPERGRVTLLLAGEPRADLESFAAEAPAGPRRVRLVALDPGHGGDDAGVTAGGLTEKELTLRLARLIQGELARRGPVGAVLLREDDRTIAAEARAERANHAHADLLIALHFDGVAGTEARGATVYCPVAAEDASGAADALGSIQVLPWRDVGLRHAVASRELAERLLVALERADRGPTRLREVLPCALLGVNLPGVLLECATLTSEADRGRLLASGGLQRLASAIVDGILAYQGGQ
jgi:N-acetylmuramoyl-L-alanine amidase